MNIANSRQDISLAAAQALLEYGMQLSKAEAGAFTMAVVDSSGHLVTMIRMDNAELATIDAAIGKAKTAAYLRAPSHKLKASINNGSYVLLTMPNILSLQGGIPLYSQHQVIGAVGVSGSTGDIDQAIAEQISQYLVLLESKADLS